MDTLRSDLFAVAVMPAIALGAALVVAGPRPRRTLGLTLGLAVLAPPWLAAPALARAVLSLLAGVAVMRLVDLYRDSRNLSARARLWHVCSPVDGRTLRRVPRRLDLAAAVTGLAWALASGGALWQAVRAGRMWLPRWAFGLVSVYGLVEALWRLARVFYLLVGFEPPPLHRHPIAARSIASLWGERWSRPISRWLDLNALRPLARRGRMAAGVALAFLLSGALHAYAVLSAADTAMAGLMLGYFLLQGALVLLERRLGVARWRPALAHAWVVGVMVATSPLFVEPALHAAGYG